MSQDTTAGTASNPTDAITDSVISNARKSGLLLSERCRLSKRQLKAFNLMSASTLLNCVNNKLRIACWNGMPSVVRDNPNLITLAVKSASYYQERRVVNLTSENVTNKVQAYLLAKSIPLVSKDGKVRTTLFEWIGRNANYIYMHYRYDSQSFLHWLEHGRSIVDGVPVEHAFELVKCQQAILDNWEQLRNIATHINRVATYRAEYRINRTPAPLSMKQRLDREYECIAATRPMHWVGSLTDFQRRLATRMRPDGACVGIELEFLATRGSEIVDWQEDDYPQHTFHQFKHDGSIGANHDSECCARYQEYTCFINADDANDWSKVRNTLKDMTENGAIVNNSCGNHVHIDMRHKSQATYYRIAGRLRDAFTTWAHRLVSHKRAYNRYCGIQNDHHNNRYTAINTACWNEHRTLEVRIGMPTLNYHKLYQWTQFLRYLANNSNSIATLDEFMAGDAPLEVKLYAIKRIANFESTYIAAGKQPLEGFAKYKQQLDSLSCIDHDYISQSITDKI
jgi:hypothetical protein